MLSMTGIFVFTVNGKNILVKLQNPRTLNLFWEIYFFMHLSIVFFFSFNSVTKYFNDNSSKNKRRESFTSLCEHQCVLSSVWLLSICQFIWLSKFLFHFCFPETQKYPHVSSVTHAYTYTHTYHVVYRLFLIYDFFFVFVFSFLFFLFASCDFSNVTI